MFSPLYINVSINATLFACLEIIYRFQNRKNINGFSNTFHNLINIRAIIAVLTGTKDLTEAGKTLSEHLKYGGSMDEVMGAFTEAMKTAGFGEEAEEPPKSGGKKTKAATE